MLPKIPKGKFYQTSKAGCRHRQVNLQYLKKTKINTVIEQDGMGTINAVLTEEEISQDMYWSQLTGRIHSSIYLITQTCDKPKSVSNFANKNSDCTHYRYQRLCRT